MADMYFYHQEDDVDEGDGELGDPDITVSPDEPPVSKLEKYAKSDNIFNRQMVTRSILETLRAVTDEAVDVAAVLNVMNQLADDQEPSVRAELMEQVPHIAMYCQEYKSKLAHVVPHHLLPMVVKFLTDLNNQVRKTSQAALLVLLEQGLVEKVDVKEQVCPVILRLTEAGSLDDYKTEAVALLSKMAPQIGKEMSEQIFLERFATLCADPLFHVRKVCAANFGDFATVVGSQSTEQVLLPKLFHLCADEVWGVRKACADAFMPVSCVCSPSVRHNELSPEFNQLLWDPSRWVRMAAFQALGPFISTFADSTITSLLHNDNGEIVISDPEKLAIRLNELEERRAIRRAEELLQEAADAADNEEKSSFSSEVSSESHPPQPSNETTTSTRTAQDESWTRASSSGKEAVDCCDTEPVISPALDPNVNLDAGEVVSMEVCGGYDGEDSAETVSVSTSDMSPEEVRAQSYLEPAYDKSFNNFMYWREPLMEVETACCTAGDDSVNDEQVVNCLTGGGLAPTTAAESANDEGDPVDEDDEDLMLIEPITGAGDQAVENADSDIGNVNKRLERMTATGEGLSVRSKQESESEESTAVVIYPIITFQSFDDMQEPIEMFRPGSGTAASDNVSANLDPALPEGPLPTIQSIVPQVLIKQYISMTDPSRLQTVDNDIAKHCAFSFPAVALTVGRSNWPLLKHTYATLASDIQWKVRRTLASSIHELGIILGDGVDELIPIFNGFLKDLDEVRIGLLRHLADFLKLLKGKDRQEYLPRLSEFLTMDNERNWRFRQELADQLGHLVHWFSPAEVKEHLSPIALVLIKDKVSSVRLTSVEVYTVVVSYLQQSDNPDMARVLLAEAADELLRMERWVYRQTFATLCLRIFAAGAMEHSQFAQTMLPHLLDLTWDKVPNVRIVVARALHHVSQATYFSKDTNPHHGRMSEAVSYLAGDRDKDVRSFFNPVPPTTSDYDSEGDFIGDVGSLPV